MVKILCAIGIATLLSAGMWAGPIANAGFETGDFTGWTLGGACSGFPVSGGGGPCWSVVSGSVPNGPFGSFSAVLGSFPTAGTIDQVITLAAGAWTISFELEETTNNPTNSFNVLWGGSTVLALTNVTPQGWSVRSANIVSNGSPTDLMFQFLQDASGNFYLDQINATAGSGVGNVPEPGTIALLGMGLAGLALVRRRIQ